MVLADRYDRSKEQLSHLVDTIYAPPMKVSSATEKALKKARFALTDQGGSLSLLGRGSLYGGSVYRASASNNTNVLEAERLLSEMSSDVDGGLAMSTIGSTGSSALPTTGCHDTLSIYPANTPCHYKLS